MASQILSPNQTTRNAVIRAASRAALRPDDGKRWICMADLRYLAQVLVLLHVFFVIWEVQGLKNSGAGFGW